MTAPRRRPTRLTALKVKEISSVDVGAYERQTKHALFASVASILGADLDDIEKQDCIAETVGQFNEYMQELGKGQTDMVSLSLKIDSRGQHLRGCLTCNCWRDSAGNLVKLSVEDLAALHALKR